MNVLLVSSLLWLIIELQYLRRKVKGQADLQSKNYFPEVYREFVRKWMMKYVVLQVMEI